MTGLIRGILQDNHKYYRQQQLAGAVSEHWIDIEHDKKHLKLSNSGGGYDVSLMPICLNEALLMRTDNLFFYAKIGEMYFTRHNHEFYT